ncbi:extracellular solute-binding protein [Solimicrobium silvestre]|uniref:Bacterial extracellular solute-binding protein n=1 Tax=Solimicrobium silvestre TaxID=2099400 RepID=A0A2S9GW38_9BURK|nr:extracellular solute-binding protein [Solimicrobium silvestre]PRC91876.1 Bacterial extracellular solute-binding protein [Solimicrobium silvestre]
MRNFLILAFLIFNATSFYNAHAVEIKGNAKEVVLSAVEQPPYVGQNLPSNGYAGQVAIEAFKRIGYTVKIEFFPLARANQMAATGQVDGQLAIYSNKASENTFLLSDPFPGGHLVLLKKIGSKITNTAGESDISTLLKSLSSYRIGAVNRVTISPEFDHADFLKKYTVNNDIENLDMLMVDQLDLAVMDKLTAGDLMAEQRPQYIRQLEVFSSLATNSFHVGFSRTSAQSKKLKEDFDRGLKMLDADGSLARIMYVHGLSMHLPSVKGKTKLTIGTLNVSSMLILQKLSVQYQKKHPDISFDWRILDEKILRLRQLTDLAVSDGQYDIMTIGAYETPIWAKNNWILPLKNLSPQYDLEDVIKPVRNMLSFQENLYGLPFYAESSMTFYRKDLVANAGLTMPEAPTYDDIKKIAAAIHAPDKQIYGICLRGDPGWGANMALITTMVNSAGGRWFDENWDPMIDTPEWKLALQTYKDLLTQYGPPNPEEQDYAKNLTLFQGGHCGIWIDATVFAGALLDAKQSKVAAKVGFTRTPVFSTANGSQWLWTWALAIPTSSKAPAEALKFIEWATSKEYIELVAKREGWLNVPPGTRASTYKDPRYRAVASFADVVFKAINEANPNNASLKPRPYIGIQFVEIPEFVSIGDNIGYLASSVLAQKISVDTALKIGQKNTTVQMRKSHIIH